METLISRSDAKRQGLKRYFTGKPCKRGHLTYRYVACCRCSKCVIEKVARRQVDDPAWTNAKNRKWKKANRPKVNHLDALRRARQLQATPKWADPTAIRVIYETCPPDYHVDHIIPLQGKNVCGLHVENNLQHLPALDNLKKSNKVDVNLVSAS